MGKSKQAKEKKFDRNVEISAPILDPEIIKAIHTPPKGQKHDIKHGGFKALLSDLNSQDSTDELAPLNDDHVPSYIGISCAVSGYSNYSSYSKRPATAQVAAKTAITNSGSTPNRSRATSPVLHTTGPEVHHITIDKSAVHSIDEERKELTEKLTASATERRRSPSPCIPPTEDDRHHGAYVGARYCPLPAPSKVVNKHIPLLGIDDEEDPDEKQEEENKVEQRIASLYGGDFVEDWRESMTHKAKKELTVDQAQTQAKNLANPKDLVTLKPTPPATTNEINEVTKPVEVPVPNVKVLAHVEKQFLNKLLTDENPPVPAQTSLTQVKQASANVGDNNEVSAPVINKATAAREDIIQIEPTGITTIGDPTVAGPRTVAREDNLQIDLDVQEEPRGFPSSDEPKATTRDDIIQIGESIGNPSTIEDSASTEDSITKSVTKEAIIHTDPSCADKKPEEAFVTRDELIQVEAADEEATTDICKPSEQATVTRDDIILIDPAIATDTTTEACATESISVTRDEIREIQSKDSPEVCIRDETIVCGTDKTATTRDDIISFESEEKPHSNILEASTSPDLEADLVVPAPQSTEEHIEYQIRAQSPVDNQSSPVKVAQDGGGSIAGERIDSITDAELETVKSDNRDGHYYLDLLDREKSFILEQVARAEALLETEGEGAEVDEDRVGRLRSAIGKANLLVNKKFNQFRDLCQANINRKADDQFATLNDDLAGFWDLLSIQVSEVQKSFESEGRIGNGSPGDNRPEAREPKERAAGGGKPKLSAQKDQKRRERLQEHISQMKREQAAKMSNENLLDD